MPKMEIVTVELIKNPMVKRQMTMASFKANPGRWRIAGTQTTQEVKKKPVERAEEEVVDFKMQGGGAIEVDQSSFANFDELENQTPPEVKEPVKPTQTATKTALQAKYEEMTGNKPDGRWSEKKLIEELTKIKNG